MKPVAAGFAAPGLESDPQQRPGLPLSLRCRPESGHKNGGVQLQREPGRARLLRVTARRGPNVLRIKSKRVRLFPGSYGSGSARCLDGRQARVAAPGRLSFIMTERAPIFTSTSKRSGKRGSEVAGLNLGLPGPGRGSAANPPAPELASRSTARRRRLGSKALEVEGPSGPRPQLRHVDVKLPPSLQGFLPGGFDGQLRISSGGPTVRAAITSKRGARARALAHRRPRSFQSGPRRGSRHTCTGVAERRGRGRKAQSASCRRAGGLGR